MEKNNLPARTHNHAAVAALRERVQRQIEATLSSAYSRLVSWKTENGSALCFLSGVSARARPLSHASRPRRISHFEKIRDQVPESSPAELKLQPNSPEP